MESKEKNLILMLLVEDIVTLIGLIVVKDCGSMEGMDSPLWNPKEI